MFDTAVFRIGIGGEVYEAPYDTDFSDITADEMKRAMGMWDGGPVALACALMFVKVQRHIEPLDDGYFPAFLIELKPLFQGDPSVIELVDDLGLSNGS